MINSCYNIVEIGSTNTKAYVYVNGTIKTCEFQNIEFKKNYLTNNSILLSDINKLAEFIKNVYIDTTQTRIYGTSIFRQLKQKEIFDFINELSKRISFKSFDVVSADKESSLTAFGAINGFDTDENICVFIGGGGSTEICIYNNQHIIESINNSIGVVDVMNRFPDLANDTTNISIIQVEKYIQTQMVLPKEKAKYLILAGGDFLLRYNNAGYPVRKNDIFSSLNHPYIVDYNSNRNFEDKYYNDISLSILRKTTPLTPKWWDGTRAMCAFTDVVAKHIKSELILPTNISMVYGIIAKLEQGQSI